MALLDRDEDDTAAARFDGVAPDDLIGGPVRALHQDVRLQRLRRSRRACPRRRSRPHRPTAAPASTSARSASGLIGRAGPLFRRTDASALRPRISASPRTARHLEVADVAGVQDIEDAVGKDDGLARRPQRRGERGRLVPREHARRRRRRRTFMTCPAIDPRVNVIAVGEVPRRASGDRCRRPWCATSRGTCAEGGGSRTDSRPACGRRHPACTSLRRDRGSRLRTRLRHRRRSACAFSSSMSVFVP